MDLSYDDPSIGYGLAGSAIAVAAPAFVIAGLALAVAGHAPAPDEVEPDQVLAATAR